MLTVDMESGMAIDYARIFKGTVDEPDEDGREIVVTMNIGDDNDELILEWSPDGRVNYSMFLPLERVQKLLAPKG